MTRDELEQLVIKAFKSEFPNISEIKLCDKFTDLNFDSLSRVMLLFRLEESISGDLSSINIQQCQNLDEIVNRLELFLCKAD